MRSVLTDLGFSDTFDSELLVPPISHLTALDHILRELELFSLADEREEAIDLLRSAGLERRDELSPRFQIGIKKLLSIIEMARQEPDNVLHRLTSALLALSA